MQINYTLFWVIKVEATVESNIDNASGAGNKSLTVRLINSGSISFTFGILYFCLCLVIDRGFRKTLSVSETSS